MSIQGERGPTGDHGQEGPHGQRGATGASGQTGKAGKDARVIGRTQVIVLFAFMVFAFIILAFRTEHDASSIRKIVHDSCVENRATLVAYNKQQDALAQVDKDNPVAADNPEGQRLQAARITAYKAAKIPVPADPCPSK